MNKYNQNKKFRPRVVRQTRFSPPPLPAAPFRGAREIELDCLKSRLLQQALKEAADPELYAPLRRAANEAASLAWTTWYPALLFPGLFEEKARAAARQTARQFKIRQRTRPAVQALNKQVAERSAI